MHFHTHLLYNTCEKYCLGAVFFYFWGVFLYNSLHKCKGFSFHVLLSLTEILKGCLATMDKELWIERANDSLVKHFYEQQSDIEQREGFESKLTFGTAGIRGKFGLGEGRLNKFTIEKLALGLARYLNAQTNNPTIVIHYDIRHLSTEFAQIIANVLANHQIIVYLPDTYKTTPELSFAVRNLNTTAGIMITASHNPKDYNGIKVYGSDGAQLSTDASELASRYIEEVGDPLQIDIPISKQNTSYIKPFPKSVTDDYMKHIQNMIGYIPKSDLQVVFTSLHGTSVPIVPELLKSLNFNQFNLVEAQCKPDPNFSSVQSANPEDHRAFDQAVELANKSHADLLISTDPDADRLGIAERDAHGHITYFNGNQIGALLLNYRIQQTSQLRHRLMIQSIVSSELTKSLARYNNVKYKEVLTGFKFIAQEIRQLDDHQNMIFAFEESYGFLSEPFVRDKDAVQIVPLIIKYASELKLYGKTLKDELEQIYQTVGRHEDTLFSHTLEGLEGKKKINEIMTKFRSNPPQEIQGMKVKAIEDYLTSEVYQLDKDTMSQINSPKSNVIRVLFDEGFIALRPSGTEPKIKLYVSLKCPNFDDVAQKINAMIFS
ncbi:TPA: phospho-sugar mutase [Staphylococcus aureus]|uniref:phospho-sugar mutase n=3 Tax=Staphylococcus aureus TaxID=1280 RepID=UPI00098F7224|nr:phospho-sugar mutase [Staphylococcus aureus]HDJ6917616.1 phospho-sugar mutase [Staphylococcus aureus Sa_TPS3169]HDJ6920220.1 phospho-sugar mutase [Staphylococcus aureus Sa_TPS3162]HDJ6928524.1 phospho-sugar mutase [Staphylococcus aureus Sa_TPS3157]HDJ6931105.1 phospho-sugar mutase [Staphylococcus aureus Sa_TPS3148]HDJ6936487.1 phospho-sugar mutase [Staphylococcus aureus Sa_TPS3161]HDJ6942081.1 phospho-sugar mutase [Staphylococcus aureus Sa_TPS3174]HDJ6947663.1 phospho-sugar mutase [Staphy